ncbi:GNAT family N-acetyltransferase [Sphaerisporangium sp. TRM90804]|uniref:GNAT family N-acetyltransferase n=1 Tax=Sphaerisporangium sp. TRM90804 TaxID=3031113 RepID=UPI00244AD130|nr:GNAT family N-acetyltransferase [Sphaerisporangium sp. TRM90804]MDH2429148.1 GNAT family N-acetyltransferase [Sphaerisporangium sp. TRM90804]
MTDTGPGDIRPAGTRPGGGGNAGSGAARAGAIRPASPAELDAAGRVAAAALTFDAADAARVVTHLTGPPPGREWTALVTPALSGVVFASMAAEGVGHVDLIAVHPSAQGRGTGRALLTAAEAWLRERGAREARIAGNPPCYAWPGVDVRYTPAVCLAESQGYERYRTAWNMTADLPRVVPPDPGDLARLAAVGVTVHTAPRGGREEVAAFARREWNDSWAWEAEHAQGCHYAVRDGRILGFAAWGVRPSWFGPMGTAEEARGLGVGRVLLRQCLRDQAAAGQRSTQIAWVGPIRFYARAAGARVQRVFWLYRRALT